MILHLQLASLHLSLDWFWTVTKYDINTTLKLWTINLFLQWLANHSHFYSQGLLLPLSSKESIIESLNSNPQAMGKDIIHWIGQPHIPIWPGLKHIQGWGIHFSAQLIPMPLTFIVNNFFLLCNQNIPSSCWKWLSLFLSLHSLIKKSLFSSPQSLLFFRLSNSNSASPWEMFIHTYRHM